MNRQQYAQRRENVRRLMHTAGLDALLVTLDANRYYLSGFELHDAQVNESSGCLIITADGKDRLCTDPRYLDAAKRLWDEEHIFIYRGSGMDQVHDLLRDMTHGTIGFEAHSLSVYAHQILCEGLTLKAADGMVESLRLLKEPGEIAAMERSCSLNHKLMDWVPGVLVPGRTEKQVAWDIEQFFRNHGAEELAFPSIVGTNANAALPHAEPGDDAILENCAVLIDVGCRLERYCSDQTRSFWVGEKPDPLFASDLNLIKEAQAKAIKHIHPGATSTDIYAVARSYLDDKGVGELFTHGLGHGVGLQTHEAPSLGTKAPTRLMPGMVVTVEPGLYRPGRHGVRWEYMILVTEDGARVL
ncbi:Xaa-Pro peptidase family protein [Desulfovibrio sp. OttesenSCG-928-G15]|nr:Xaa-Pro peptidase family protein [Desulfovibrio sp. OttesenSCG-928-G15]